MRAQDLLRTQFRRTHAVLEQVIDDCSPEALSHIADGTIGSIASIYAHLVYGEDRMVARAAGREPIWEAGGWSAKTGLDEPAARQTEEWVQSSPQYDRAAFREYAQAVYAATDDYLSSVSDEDFEVEVETVAGTQPAGVQLGTIGLSHVTLHQGEIAALKGLQGLKGLPF